MDMHAEEERLLEVYWRTRSVEDRNRAVEAHLRYAAMIARRFSGKGVEYEELYQVASLSLIKAMERFDPSKEVKFTTFAMPTMAGEVKNYFRDRVRIIRMPRNSQSLIQTIERTRSELEQELLRSPTPDEIADKAGLTLEEVVEAMALNNTRSVTSLDAELAADDENSASLSAVLGAEEAGFADFEMKDEIRRALAALNEQERQCVKLRFFDNHNQRETAQIMGVSQMTISRMERKIMERLRSVLTQE